MASKEIPVITGDDATELPEGAITVTVEAVGSGSVILPALDLLPDWTINEVKEQILEKKTEMEYDPVYSRSYRLFVGHGGAELEDGYQLVKHSALYSDCTIVVVINGEKDKLLYLITSSKGRMFELFRDAPPELVSDKDIVIAGVTCDADRFRRLSAELRSDKNVALAAMAVCWRICLMNCAVTRML